MSGTITDIRTWSKGADSEVPSPAWNIYVDSQGQLWWHEQNSVKWTQILRGHLAPACHVRGSGRCAPARAHDC
jgi:hypothetical protein